MDRQSQWAGVGVGSLPGGKGDGVFGLATGAGVAVLAPVNESVIAAVMALVVDSVVDAVSEEAPSEVFAVVFALVIEVVAAAVRAVPVEARGGRD